MGDRGKGGLGLFASFWIVSQLHWSNWFGVDQFCSHWSHWFDQFWSVLLTLIRLIWSNMLSEHCSYRSIWSDCSYWSDWFYRICSHSSDWSYWSDWFDWIYSHWSNWFDRILIRLITFIRLVRLIWSVSTTSSCPTHALAARPVSILKGGYRKIFILS